MTRFQLRWIFAGALFVVAQTGCFSATGDSPDAGATSGSPSSTTGSTTTATATSGSGTSVGASTGQASTSVGASSVSTTGNTTGTGIGSATTGTSTGSSFGTTTGGFGPDAGCALTEYNTDTGCFEGSPCNCDQWCVTGDPYMSLFQPGGVCETPCNSDADCPNAASTCTDLATPLNPSNVGKTCTINLCAMNAVPGSTCAAGNDAPGTCIPVDDLSFGRICMPDGPATACTEGVTNDDPFFAFQMGDVQIASPQPNDAGLFCASGQGCYAFFGVASTPGTCQQLCPAPADGGIEACGAPSVCVLQDPHDKSWGYCLPCGASTSDGGTAATCVASSDCCEKNCGIGAGDFGSCLPAP